MTSAAPDPHPPEGLTRSLRSEAKRALLAWILAALALLAFAG